MDFFSMDITCGKLILLYFLKKTDSVLSEEQIMRVILDQEWMDYFSFCQAAGDLKDGGLISIDNATSEDILIVRKEGEEALETFMSRIPESIREQIDDFANKNRQLLNESKYLATYEWIEKDTFMVSLQIFDQNKLIYHAKVRVSSREDAQKICEQWPKQADAVYYSTISLLTSEME